MAHAALPGRIGIATMARIQVYSFNACAKPLLYRATDTVVHVCRCLNVMTFNITMPLCHCTCLRRGGT